MIVKYKYKDRIKEDFICDFCNTPKPISQLNETGKDRYSPDYEKFGKEVVCNKCLDTMRKY